jgi:hypothetical protein
LYKLLQRDFHFCKALKCFNFSIFICNASSIFLRIFDFRIVEDIAVFFASDHLSTYLANDSSNTKSKYKEKLNTLLDSGIYVPLPKDPTPKVEGKIQKLLSKHKTTLPIDLKHRLTPCHSKPLHLYGLPAIHKLDIPLRPTVSFLGSSCYALADFLHKIPSPLAGKSESFIKNSVRFIQLLKSVNLQSSDILVSFDVVSLFTHVPVDEALQVIRNKLHNDDTLAGRSALQVEAIMELLEVCLRTTFSRG